VRTIFPRSEQHHTRNPKSRQLDDGTDNTFVGGEPAFWGPVESVTGVLMCGISVSGLFASATRLVERESGDPPKQDVIDLDGRREEAEPERV